MVVEAALPSLFEAVAAGLARDENHLAIYPAVTNEAAHHHQVADTGIHQLHRGTTRAAARALHTLVTVNDDRARTLHSVAERTDRDVLPAIVAALLDRNDQRRAERAQSLARAHHPNPCSRSGIRTHHRHHRACRAARTQPRIRSRTLGLCPRELLSQLSRLAEAKAQLRRHGITG